MNPMLNIAIRAARAGGRILLRHFDNVETLNIKSKGLHDFVSEVDQNAEAEIIEVLRQSFPDHAILAEESGIREGNDYQWVIDPLDGTTNYIHGLPHFCVSIALKYRGRLEVGVVYDPIREEMFTASRGSGAQLNDRKLRVSNRKELNDSLIGTGFPYRDFQHLDAYMGMFKDLATKSAGIRRPGSAALDLSYLAAGRTDGFWELGLSEWDMAAGALIVREAGGIVTDIAGGENHLKSGNVIAGGIKIHNAMLRTIRPHLTERLRS
jgi:myo-inositol-1(or 4)-monophosphatase